MRRLYTKKYVLTKRGLEITTAAEKFIAEIVAKNPTADPIDLQCVVTQAMELSLSRHNLDTIERLATVKRGKPKCWRKRRKNP